MKYAINMLLVLMLLPSISVVADDKTALEIKLKAFLAGVDQKSVHADFWADDLVYTSSAGNRINKADILAGFDEPDAQSSPATLYSAQDVDIRVYGNTAVLAFVLLAKVPDKQAKFIESYYLNTGTFVKRQGSWQAVAWQATKKAPAASH